MYSPTVVRRWLPAGANFSRTFSNSCNKLQTNFAVSWFCSKWRHTSQLLDLAWSISGPLLSGLQVLIWSFKMKYQLGTVKYFLKSLVVILERQFYCLLALNFCLHERMVWKTYFKFNAINFLILSHQNRGHPLTERSQTSSVPQHGLLTSFPESPPSSLKWETRYRIQSSRLY